MNMMNKESSYVDDISIELAILQQDIELPEITKEPLTLETLTKLDKQGKEYKLKEREYQNMIGNFYIPILFPLVENGESTELVFDAPKTGNILNESLVASTYVERNYVSLLIPKHLVMLFEDVIPKDTIFLIGLVGGGTDIEDINIIGVYSGSIL